MHLIFDLNYLNFVVHLINKLMSKGNKGSAGWPSTTGGKSGGGRINNPPAPKPTPKGK